MTDSQWGIVAMLILLAGLIFYIRKANNYTEEWFGENSFLKKPRTYEVKFRNLIDLELFYSLNALILSLILFKTSFQLLNDLQYFSWALLFVFGMFLFAVSVFVIYWKSLFFKQNGDKSYYFDPIEKYFSIIKYDELKIEFSKIIEIDFYSTHNKLSISFCILTLKNSEKIALTKELKNYFYLSDFFAGIKQNHQKLSFSLFYKWLIWMKNN